MTDEGEHCQVDALCESAMISPSGSAVTSLVKAALIFVGSFLVMALAMDRGLSVYDEGLILVGATRVAAGDIPHRDFYANYGPAQFYALAALFKLFGPSILVERLWDIAIRAATVPIVFLFVRAVGTRREAIVASALVGVWLASLGNPAYPIFPALLFFLVALLCLVPTFDSRPSSATAFGSGVSLGVTVLFRYDAGIVAVGVLSAVVAAHALAQPRPWRAIAATKVLLPLWAGLAVIVAPLIVVFVALGMTRDFAFDIFEFPAKNYWRMRSLPFPTPRMLVDEPMTIGVYLPPVIWATALLAIFARCRLKPSAFAARDWAVASLVLLSALFFLKGMVRVSLLQMTLSILPALIVAALVVPLTPAALRAKRPMPQTIAIMAAFVLVMLPSVISVRFIAQGAGETLAWVMRADTWAPAAAATSSALAPCHPSAGLGRMACFAIDPAEAKAVRYVETHSRALDDLYVGLDRHDRLFANDNIFYFLAGRHPATKYSHFDPGLQTSADIQAIMIDELKAKRPPLIVLDSGFDYKNEPNDSAKSSGIVLLDDFLRDTYRPVKTFGSLTIMARKGG